MGRDEAQAAGQTLDELLGIPTKHRLRGRFAGSLAKPCPEEYSSILAIHLIAGAVVYGLVSSLVLALWGLRGLINAILNPGSEAIHGFVLNCMATLTFGVVATAVVAGGVGLLCLVVVPLFDWMANQLGVLGVARRAGGVVGAGVACLLVAPFWGAAWSVAGTGWRDFAFFCAWSAPLVVMLQAAGTLAAPGDLLSRRSPSRRFGIRGLLISTTGAAVLAAMLAAGGAMSGLALLTGMGVGTHFVMRRPIRWLLRRLLKRRFVRRRRGRRAPQRAVREA